jgi:hypothetical protein
MISIIVFPSLHICSEIQSSTHPLKSISSSVVEIVVEIVVKIVIERRPQYAVFTVPYVEVWWRLWYSGSSAANIVLPPPAVLRHDVLEAR